MDTEGNEIEFKKRTKKTNHRKRRAEQEEDSDEESLKEKLELCVELRKLRERPKGVNAITLALGKNMGVEERNIGVRSQDPFKTATGGMVDMESIKDSKYQPDEQDAYETGIGITQFSAETNTRDEDAEMVKYIEEKLKERKRAASSKDLDASEEAAKKYLSPEEAALLQVPEHLRKASSKRSEEMLSNQMLSGIPEVDLGIDVKIKNIEATEDAKQKILRDRMNKKEAPSQFVPTNMAVNFVQHNRFNIEDNHTNKKVQQQKLVDKPKKVVVVGSEPEEQDSNSWQKDKGERATDDFHFEKFKKQFKRY